MKLGGKLGINVQGKLLYLLRNDYVRSILREQMIQIHSS